MAGRWNHNSDELSPWVDGIVNGETSGLKFVHIFHYEISGTIRDRNDIRYGQTVQVRLRKRKDASSTHASQHDVEDICVVSPAPSVHDVRCQFNNVFISAEMTPEFEGGTIPTLFNSYLGKAYDYKSMIPGDIFRKRRPVKVEVLAKPQTSDKTRARLHVVRFHGLVEGAVMHSLQAETLAKPARGLVRRCGPEFYYVWCFEYPDELQLRKDLLEEGQEWVGKWIMFDMIMNCYGGSRRITMKPQPKPDPCPTEVRNGIVVIRVNCNRIQVSGSEFEVLETKGAGRVVDSDNILRGANRSFPCFLWIEPENQVSGYQWRVSSKNREVSPVGSSNKNDGHIGVITTVNQELCWIWCKDFPIDVVTDVTSLKSIPNPIGKWVSFKEVIVTRNKYRTRSDIVPLNKDAIPTRIRHNVPELQVTCLHERDCEQDESLVFWTEEVGEVADIEGMLGSGRTFQFPFTAWAVKYRDAQKNCRSRWKISTENDYSMMRVSTPIAMPKETSPRTKQTYGNVGCIVTLGEFGFWIYSPDYPKDIMAENRLLDGISDPVGKWVSFSAPTGPDSKLATNKPITPLGKDIITTRVSKNYPEFEVTCISHERNDEDGSTVFMTREVGEISDADDVLGGRTNIRLPFKVWVLQRKMKDFGCRSRFIISLKNDGLRGSFNTPQNIPPAARSYCGVVVNELFNTCWIFCPDLQHNVVMNKDLWPERKESLIGEWVRFDDFIDDNGRQRTLGPVEASVAQLESRVIDGNTQIYTTCYSEDSFDPKGLQILRGKVGSVIDLHRLLRNTSFPFDCWVEYYRDLPMSPKWKIAQMNDILDRRSSSGHASRQKTGNTGPGGFGRETSPYAESGIHIEVSDFPKREKPDPFDRRCAVGTSKDSSRDTSARSTPSVTRKLNAPPQPKLEEKVEVELNVSSSTASSSSVSPPPGLDNQTRPVSTSAVQETYADKSLIYLCNAVLENRELCGHFKEINLDLYNAFSYAVFAYEE